jgi:hypothetical protein
MPRSVERNGRCCRATRLLRLDVVDFREFAARQPELLQMIEAENARRTAPPAR